MRRVRFVVALVALFGFLGVTQSAMAVTASNFPQSADTVLPGSQITLHWNAAPSGYAYYLTTSQQALPTFANAQWPSGSSSSWISSYGFWATGATSVTLSIPANATAGTSYGIQLYTCAFPSWQCLPTVESTTLTVALSSWGSEPASSVFSSITHASLPAYASTFATFGPPGTAHASDIFASSESIDDIETDPLGGSLRVVPNPVNDANKPFANCSGGSCTSTANSSLAEGATAGGDGLVWISNGGGYWYTIAQLGGVNNASEAVAYDPNTGGVCTFVLSPNSAAAMGITTTGSGTNMTVWIAESNPNQLVEFQPGITSCPAGGQGYFAWTLPSYKTIAVNAIWANDVVADPDGTHLWVTEPWGPTGQPQGKTFVGGVVEVNGATGSVTQTITWNTANSDAAWGPSPAGMVVNKSYVYVIDQNDNRILRISKATGTIDSVPLPVTSDETGGGGLTLDNGKLFFSTGGGTPSFGYIDVSSWGAASPAPSAAEILTGLTPLGGSWGQVPGYGSIASASDGEVAVPAGEGIYRLSP